MRQILWTVITICLLVALVGCNKDEPTSSGVPGSGTTKTFHILSAPGNPCGVKRLASDAEAQRICIELGYEDMVSYVTRRDCGGEHSNQGWVEDVTCWKP